MFRNGLYQSRNHGLILAVLCVECLASRTTDGDSSGLCSLHLLHGDLMHYYWKILCFVFSEARFALRRLSSVSQSVSHEVIKGEVPRGQARQGVPSRVTGPPPLPTPLPYGAGVTPHPEFEVPVIWGGG